MIQTTLFKKSVVLMLLIALSVVSVSGYTYVNETMTSNNATLWSDVGVTQFNANFNTNQYGIKYPITDTNIVSVPLTTSSNRLSYGKQIDLDFSFMVNNTGGSGPVMSFVGGFGVTTGYPKWYIMATGTSSFTLNLYEGSNVVYSQTIGGGTLYRVKMKNIGSNSYLYLNDVLVYSNSSSTLTIYDTDNELYFGKYNTGPGIEKTNAFLNNITLTQYDAGYIANFTIIDEVTGALHNDTIFYGDLYDTDFNYLRSYQSSSGYLYYVNLTASTPYIIRYHDSIYNIRSYLFTTSVFSNNFTLYALNTTSGNYVTFTVKDYKGSSPMSNVRINVSALINNTYQLVYSGITDFAGQANVFLDTDKAVLVSLSKPGYNSFVGSLPVIVSPYAYTLTLTGTNSYLDLSSINDFFTAYYSPGNSAYLKNKTREVFTFNVSSPLNSLSYYGITAIINGVQYDNHSISIGGSALTIDTVPGVYNVPFNVTYYIKVHGYDNYTVIVPYVVSSYEQYSVPDNLQNLKSTTTEFERIGFALMTAIVLGIILSFVVPVIFIFIAIVGVLGLFTWIGWFNGWIFGLIVLITFAIMLRGNQNG